MGAMSPLFCSSKSLLSANGSVALACFNEFQREFRRGLALGMEMALQRVNLLSARRLNIQDQMIGQGESGRRSRNRNHKLPSGCHRLLLPHCHDLQVGGRGPSVLTYIKAVTSDGKQWPRLRMRCGCSGYGLVQPSVHRDFAFHGRYGDEGPVPPDGMLRTCHRDSACSLSSRPLPLSRHFSAPYPATSAPQKRPEFMCLGLAPVLRRTDKENSG